MKTLSLLASQSIRSGKGMSVSIDTIKCFFAKIGERNIFKKKSDSQHENPMSTELSVNEVMETIWQAQMTLLPRNNLAIKQKMM